MACVYVDKHGYMQIPCLPKSHGWRGINAHAVARELAKGRSAELLQCGTEIVIGPEMAAVSCTGG
jgi:hypothetical protein